AEALADDVRPEHEQVAATRGGDRGRDRLADVAGHEAVRGIDLVVRRRVREDEDRSGPAAAERLAGLRALGPASDLVAAASAEDRARGRDHPVDELSWHVRRVLEDPVHLVVRARDEP